MQQTLQRRRYAALTFGCRLQRVPQTRAIAGGLQPPQHVRYRTRDGSRAVLLFAAPSCEGGEIVNIRRRCSSNGDMQCRLSQRLLSAHERVKSQQAVGDGSAGVKLKRGDSSGAMILSLGGACCNARRRRGGGGGRQSASGQGHATCGNEKVQACKYVMMQN